MYLCERWEQGVDNASSLSAEQAKMGYTGSVT